MRAGTTTEKSGFFVDMNSNRDSKNRFAKKLVFGVGINDASSPIKKGSAQRRAYDFWLSMLSRCLSDSYKGRQKTYKNCNVCEEWILFSNFESWFYENYRDGYALDKDIIKKGNKTYCPELCSFVPREINNLIEKSNAIRGELPIGVAKYKDRFRSSLTINNASKHIGVFDTKEEAFRAYKREKEAHIKNIATKYYNNNKIERRIYDALMNYKVEITD